MTSHLRVISLSLAGIVALRILLAAGPADACGQPLTVQDIQNGIMPSEANLPCKSSSGGGGNGGISPDSAARIRAQNEQRMRWKRASALNSQANDAVDNGDTKRAIALYQEALDLFSANGDQKNIAIVQRNLDIARKEFAAIKDDNRVAEAQSRFADQNIYKAKSNPFAAAPNPNTATASGSGNRYDPRSNCSTITGPGMSSGGSSGCGGGGNLVKQPGLRSDGRSQMVQRPQIWRSGGVAPDVQAEIMTLAETLLGKADNDPERPKLVRTLMRRLADHRVAMTMKDIACLQPTSGTDQKLLDLPLRWRPEHIKKEAIDRSHLCDGYAEGEAKDICREQKYGEAVMWAEPELAGQCRTAEMPGQPLDAVAECARRKFLNGWARNNGIVAAPTPGNWVMPATCGASAPLTARKQTLRDLLRAKLEAVDDSPGGDEGHQSQPLTPAPATMAETSSPPQPPAIDDNEAYCSYMAREVVRGELTPTDATGIPPGCKATMAAAEALKAKQKTEGVTPFSMNADETDEQIQRLLRQ
jgi:hypothetical protein